MVREIFSIHPKHTVLNGHPKNLPCIMQILDGNAVLSARTVLPILPGVIPHTNNIDLILLCSFKS